MKGKVIKWFSDSQRGQIQIEDGRFFNFTKDDIKGSHTSKIKTGMVMIFNVESQKQGSNAKDVRPEGYQELASDKQARQNNKDSQQAIYSFHLYKEAMDLLYRNIKIDNYALMYHRIAVVTHEKDKASMNINPYIYAKMKNKEKPLEEELKYCNDIIKHTALRNQRIANTIFSKKLCFSFKVSDKLVIGTGSPSPYGNIPLMTFHHIYGIPYIPATTLKGCVRSCYIVEEFGGNEKKALADEKFRFLFGSGREGDMEGQRGSVVFLDAYPTQTPTLVFDVITPHHKSYYDSQNNPTDDENPVPIFIPAILPVNFDIYSGFMQEHVLLTEDIYNKLKEYVQMTLEKYGIGAKKSIGYGLGLAESKNI